MMLDNATYDKVKVLCHLSELCWFIEKHAQHDAAQAGDAACKQMMLDLKKDLEKHIEAFQRSMCIVTQ